MGRCYRLVLDCPVPACCMLKSLSEARGLASVVLEDFADFFFPLLHKNSYIPTILYLG